MMMIRTFIAIAALAISSTAQAASITTDNRWAPMVPHIYIDGEIVPGDARAFAAVAATIPNIALVFLDSPGGEVHEAVAIGRMIRAKGYLTVVDRHPQNAACAIIWLAGTHCIIRRNSILIFHRARNLNGSEAPDADQYVATYLRDLGYNDVVINYVMRAAPSEAPLTMEWHVKLLGIAYQIVPAAAGWGGACKAHFCVVAP
jgi:hypothetical protein